VDSGLFYGGSIVAAVIAGMIALFAPCCISVMLPAYFSSSFQNRRVLVAMTFVFAAGVAAVILPIAMGASLLRQLITEQHALLYTAAGLFMLVLGVLLLLGWQMHLPMPGRPAGKGNAGPWSVFSLGVFSGVASSCCAPVLAGVIALSSVASSFWAALTLGLAYVFGMVAPLFLISILWEQADWRKKGIFKARSVTWRLGRLKRTLPLTNVLSGVLLAVMGLATVYAGWFIDAMARPSGWQYTVAIRLNVLARSATQAFAWLPNWLAALALLALVAALAYRAFRQLAHPDRQGGSDKGEPA
jgi:cytochrome c-type biogenesis protein